MFVMAYRADNYQMDNLSYIILCHDILPVIELANLRKILTVEAVRIAECS